ncbi:hypothetical protein T265_15109, partial [Opisthorchis viverrini]
MLADQPVDMVNSVGLTPSLFLDEDLGTNSSMVNDTSRHDFVRPFMNRLRRKAYTHYNPENSPFTLSLEDKKTNRVLARFGTSASNRTVVYNRILRLNLEVNDGMGSGIQFAINVTGINILAAFLVPCDLRLGRHSGNITWLGTDRWYRSNVCRWTIEVSERNYIILNFDTFRVHTPSNWSLNISTSAPARSEVFEAAPSVSHRIILSNKAHFEMKISTSSSRCLSLTIRYSS